MKRKYLILSAILTVLLMSAGAFSQTTKVNQPSSDLQYGIGDLVEAQDYRGAWYKSKIVGIENGKYKVHYFGWDDAWSELVAPEKVRDSTDHDFGSEVEVEQNGVWYKALIVDSRYGAEHLVTYVGYNEDEWVKDERIRGYSANRSDSRLGKKVEVLSKGKWYSARIIDRRRDEVYVHYDGYDDTFNEWVPANRVRRGFAPKD
ncbi:MAG: agenet domain-containing protein [Actinomycetota bacterium]